VCSHTCPGDAANTGHVTTPRELPSWDKDQAASDEGERHTHGIDLPIPVRTEASDHCDLKEHGAYASLDAA